MLYLNDGKLLAKERPGTHHLKEALKCPNCGKTTQPDHKYCPSCGKRMD